MEQHIIPECYIDTRIVKTLLPSKRRYNHQHGCYNVEKTVSVKFKGDFALGIVDKDKRLMKYLKECTSVCELPDFLQLFKHGSEKHYIILIKPAIERWIVNTAAMAGLSLPVYELPGDLDKLCDLTKTSREDVVDPNSKKFYQLFKDLNKLNPPSVAVLKFWITYLKDNPYNADLTYLIEQTAVLASGQ